MNQEQTAAILAVLASAWPRVELTEHTARIWARTCNDIDPDDALLGAEDVIREDPYFPSIARFRQATEVHTHARRNRSADARGLPSGQPRWVKPPERLVAASRQLLAEMKTKNHKHGGPKPCPICGGLQPPKSRQDLRPERPSTNSAPLRDCGIKGCLSCHPRQEPDDSR